MREAGMESLRTDCLRPRRTIRTVAAALLLCCVTGCTTPQRKMYLAVRDADRSAVERLLAGGYDFDAETGFNSSLTHAIRFKRATILVLLIRAGADVNHAPASLTPLQIAAETGDLRITALLIQNGANPEAGNLNGTALHRAAIANRPEAARLLIERGADPNATDPAGDTPLHVAGRKGYLAVARILLEHGARTDLKNARLETPLETARRRLDQVIAGLKDPKTPEVKLESLKGKAAALQSMISYLAVR